MKEIEEKLKQNAILPHGVLLCVLVPRKIANFKYNNFKTKSFTK
jgi:hypothetical protein